MGQFPGKVDNSTFSTKICPKNGFRFEISQKFCQNKNQHPGDLGLEVQKTNVQIRINILEIQFSFKTGNFDFSLIHNCLLLIDISFYAK